MNRVISCVYLLTLLLILQLIHCKLDSTAPTEFQSEKSRFTVTVPENVSADLYKVSILDSTDTIVYFENAKSKNLQILVSSKLKTTIIVDAIKDNASVYSGFAMVTPGETRSISLENVVNTGVVAPDNFDGEVTNDNKVSLFWNAVTGAVTYSVKRSTDGTSWTEIISTQENAYIDTDVKAGQTYYYKIVVSGQGSVSEPSNTINVSVPGEVINPVSPSTPSSVNAQAVSMNSIRVTWDNVANAVEYVASYKKTINGTFTEVTSDTTEITINGLDESTSYTITVAARNSAGTSASSTAISCTTLSKSLEKPAVPSNVAVIALSEKSINVTWDNVNGASTYTVLYSTQANGTFTTRTSSTNNLVLESLTASTTYYIKVTAGNTAGTSDASAVVSVKTQEPAVQPPSSPVLSASTVSDTSLKVTWNAVSNASMYIIERSLTLSGSFNAVCTTAALSYTDTKCTAGTMYYYRGKAGNSAGYSSYSEISSATTDVALSAPGALTKGTVTDSSIAISWQAASGALSYKIYFSTSQSGPYEVHGISTSVQYTLNSLTAGTTYYIKVTSINGTRESVASGVLSVQTAVKAPSVPSGVTAAASTTSVTITWNTIESATSYIIYGGTSSSSLAQIGTSTTATYTQTGLTAATVYYYAVASVNTGGTSAKSTVTSATTGVSVPGVPSGVTAKAASSTSITVTWSAVSGATSYIVYSGTSSSSLAQIGTSTSAGYTQTGLTSATTYYYAIASVNAGGTSDKSSVTSTSTGSDAPSIPTGLTATAASSTSMTVKFNTVSGATGYQLYWSSNNSTFSLLSSLTSTTYTHTGLTANTTYYYKVSSVNGTAESAQSSSVSAKTSAATKIAVISSSCIGCGRCPSACSRGAIYRSGSKYVIDASKCNGCGNCLSRCPVNAISLK